MSRAARLGLRAKIVFRTEYWVLSTLCRGVN